MKKKLLLFFLTAVSTMSVKAQLLYRISGNGLQKESYIVGTYHVADGTYVDQIPGARQTIAGVDQVCGELEFSTSTENVDSMAVLTQRMRLPEGTTLKDVLTKEQFDKLDAYVEKTLGMKLSNALLFGQMGGMSPASLTQTLTLMKVMLKMQKEGKFFDAQNAIDGYIQKQAKEAGKKTLGLETIAFQAEVLLGSPMERQVENLMCMIDNEAYYDQFEGRLIQYYYEQDVEKLHNLMQEKLGNSCDSTPEEMDVLLYNRNSNWLKIMPSIMKNASTLFVVGAGHLGGERGVLKGLRDAGYKVDGVK